MEGKIYAPEKVEAALANFFTPENLITLRELALRETASSVDRAREEMARLEAGEPARPRTVDRILVAMSSNPPYTAAIVRQASRIAGRLNSDWFCVYVQTPDESAERVETAVQRKLVENIQLAQSLGAEVKKLVATDVADALCRFAVENGVTLIVVGQSRRSWWHRLRRGSVISKLLENRQGLNVLVVSYDEATNENR
jgi:two-component system sensor histidine kinase KdpD